MSEFEELISKLLEKVPELSRSVIEERINEKKEKVGAGYLTDQGAIFLVAADLGVSLEQTQNSEVAIKDLYIGAKEVTLESRVLNISPTKQFTKKDGSSFSLRTITVYDNNSTASVKLWDEKANLPGLEELKPGDLIKIIKIPSAILVFPCSSLVFAPKHTRKLIRTRTIDKTFAYLWFIP